MNEINSFQLPPTEAIMKSKKFSPGSLRQTESLDCIADKENMHQSYNNIDNISPCPAELAKYPSASEYFYLQSSCNILSSEFDIENAYHPSSARGSSEKAGKYPSTKYSVVKSVDRRGSSKRVLDHDIPKLETALGSPNSEEAKVTVSPDSPNTTIMTLKKGQRVKDGMILMLTSQVDRRKQLLLGAQEQAQKMSEMLCQKEEEVAELNSKVKGLQGTVQGSDGRIALLQFQLQKTKNVLKAQSDSATLAAIPAPLADCQSPQKRKGPHHIEGTAVDDVMYAVENAPHSSAFKSPDRMSWLLHWRRSQSLRANIVERSYESTCKADYFISNASTPMPIQLPLTIDTAQLPVSVSMSRKKGTSPRHGEREEPSPMTNFFMSATPRSVGEGLVRSAEHRIVAQERLNLRLTEQLKAWVGAQIDLHAKLADEEAAQILGQRSRNLDASLGLHSSANDVSAINDSRRGGIENQFGRDDCLKMMMPSYGNDDVSFLSRTEGMKVEDRRSTDSVHYSHLLPPSPFQKMLSVSSISPTVTRTLFKGVESNLNSVKIENRRRHVDESGTSQTPKKSVSGRKEDLMIMSPQYSQLLLVEVDQEEQERYDCSMISDDSDDNVFMGIKIADKVQMNIDRYKATHGVCPASNVTDVPPGDEDTSSSAAQQRPSLQERRSIQNGSLPSSFCGTVGQDHGISATPAIKGDVRHSPDNTGGGVDGILSPLQRRLIAPLSSSKSNMKPTPLVDVITVRAPVVCVTSSASDVQTCPVPYSVTYSMLTGEDEEEDEEESIEHDSITKSLASPQSHNLPTSASTPTASPTVTHMDTMSTQPPHMEVPLRSTPSYRRVPSPGKIFERLLSRKSAVQVAEAVVDQPPSAPLPSSSAPLPSSSAPLPSSCPYVYAQEHETAHIIASTEAPCLEYLHTNPAPHRDVHLSPSHPSEQLWNQKYQGPDSSTAERVIGMDYTSLTHYESYRPLPVGRRSMSREKGAVTSTQNRSTQLQAKLRALEAETAREREKNKVLFLTQDMHAHANTLNSHFQTSTPQYTESKTYSPDDPTHMRTIAPKETPQKTTDVSDLSAAFLEKRSRIRELGISFSPPVRPTLSPTSFCKEMTRLKNENYSIRDDISRFRNTLQALRAECREGTTAKYLQSVHALDVLSLGGTSTGNGTGIVPRSVRERDAGKLDNYYFSECDTHRESYGAANNVTKEMSYSGRRGTEREREGRLNGTRGYNDRTHYDRDRADYEDGSVDSGSLHSTSIITHSSAKGGGRLLDENLGIYRNHCR